MTFQVPNSPDSCLIRINHSNVRCLIDTGSELTLMKKAIYDNLPIKPRLERNNVTLQSANGSDLSVVGKIQLDFKIQGLKFNHTFIIVKDLTRSAMLGRDFLSKNDAKLFFNINKMCIRKVFIPLENDRPLAAISRATQQVTIAPQSACIIMAQIKNNGN